MSLAGLVVIAVCNSRHGPRGAAQTLRHRRARPLPAYRWGTLLAYAVVFASLWIPSIAGADMKQHLPSWTQISAFWNNGTVPPPHRRSGRLVIGANGQARRVQVRGYDPNPDTETVQAFELDSATLQALTAQLDALKAFSTRWQVLDPHPIGGSMRWVHIETSRGTIEVPAFPVPSQRERADQIFAAIAAVVPATSSQALDADPE